MSVEKEAGILASFKERAEKGEIIEVSEIEAAYQAEVDHPIGNSQIYFVLHRHGWRIGLYKLGRGVLYLP